MADEPLAPSSSSIQTVGVSESRLAPRATTKTGALSARVKPKTISSARAGKPLRKPPTWVTRVTVNDAELDALTKRRNSPTGQALMESAKHALPIIRANAPASAKGSHGRKPGYLRQNIVAYLGEDASGVYAGIATRARAKGKGRSYYGRIQNQRGPYKDYLARGLRSAGG